MQTYRFLFLASTILLTGCMGLSSYQNPEILPKGEKSVGVSIPLVGVTEPNGFFGFISPEIYGRAGLGHGIDLGWRLPFFFFADGFLLGLNGDLRYGYSWTPHNRILFTFKGNSWIASQEFLFLASPMVGWGYRNSLVSVGPVFYSNLGGSHRWIGWRLEGVSEREVSWGVIRPELTLTLLNPTEDWNQRIFLLTAGAGFELRFPRSQPRK